MYVYLYAVVGLALLVSFIANHRKTLRALKIAFKRFTNILPVFLIMLVLVSIVLFFVSDETISNYRGAENKFVGVAFASFFGSITLMPGFIAFPLCGVLLQKGVVYTVLAAFTTTLMMVGVVTAPVEKEYLGIKVTIVRNIMSFFIALIVAVVMGIFFGEIFI
ncbi:permease [Chloroflexota bacterium]